MTPPGAEGHEPNRPGPGRLEHRAVALVQEVLRVDIDATPTWLSRPARPECGDHWGLISDIYEALEPGRTLPAEVPPRERRKVDAVLVHASKPPRILEIDEAQHFNAYRATTLHAYPPALPLAFDRADWIRRSEAKRRLEGGGFAKPRPPLFPGPNGRHRQRAFRDALTDILPTAHGWQPTLRLAHFELTPWINTCDARRQMTALLATKGIGVTRSSRGRL